MGPAGGKAQLDDPGGPFLHAGCRNLLWSGPVAASRVFAGSSRRQTNARRRSVSRAMGISVRSFFAGSGGGAVSGPGVTGREPSWRDAVKIDRVVDAALSRVARHLRVRAERAR